MELDQRQYDTGEPLPPSPPPKPDIELAMPSPVLPPTPSHSFKFRSSSPSSSPSGHHETAGSLSPQVNGASGAVLAPPSLNPVAHDSTAPPPSPSSSSKGKQNKKTNPLTDLVESEREYIDVLADIIRKVAGAWSRTNFPPKQLDAMFRGIEAVYKANRGLLTKLKDIGPTPTSPKALGDLLMRWIDDLDAPYTKYCTNFAAGFDEWTPVTSNARLPPILAAMSAVHPPPPTAADSDDNGSPIWTLDALFALPRARLKYYKKLYTRLLKSTQVGRSDHKLLTGAVDKLESLLGILAQRESIVMGLEANEQTLDAPPSGDSRTQSPLQHTNRDSAEKVISSVSGSETMEEQARRSASSSIPHSSLSSEARDSRDKEFSRAGGRTASSATMSMPISDLEKRLSAERTLDLFTLKPKSVRLQMNPPSLPFTRTLRLSHNVEIHFTPRLTPDSPRVHTRGHIFLLTDLFLVCEVMTPYERHKANSEADGQDYDMWLLYPPLAGKHLRVTESSEHDNVLQIQILKKETFFLHTESKATRDHMMSEFKECIEAGNMLSPRAGQPPPPPVPPLKEISQSSSDPVLQQRGSQLSSNTRASSGSPVATSSVNPSPQSFDQGRPFGDAAESSRHESFPTHPETQQPFTTQVVKDLPVLPSVNVTPTDPRDGRMPSSSSQPQMRSSGSPPQFHFQQPSNASLSTHYVPPPRGASHSYHNPAALAQMTPPVRPATAQGEPQFWGPSTQMNHPGQYPPRMQNQGSAYPSSLGPYQNGQSVAPSSGRPPSDPMANARLRKSPSAHSLGSQFPSQALPPVPGYATPAHGQSADGFHPRNSDVNFSTVPHVHQPHPRAAFAPSATFNPRGSSFAATSSWGPSTREPSPPNSPLDEEPAPQRPVTSAITAQFKCKVFLKLDHGQWKSLGGARLKLYLQQPTNVKQLVVEADTKDKTMLISTIVLTDGVERVGKTGVAIELSDKGTRTGIVYMIQLRNETSASGLFDSLLAGSDRAAGRTGKG